jgi:hypothetical protein
MRVRCEKPVRGFPGEKCQLDYGHGGYHSCVTFVCEDCGRVCRGTPHRTSYVTLGDGSIDDVFQYCWICSGDGPRRTASERWRRRFEKRMGEVAA